MPAASASFIGNGSTDMTTYRDHPLAFLSARVSVESLRGRAETWRAKGLSVAGIDAMGALVLAADQVEARKAEIARVADLIQADADVSDVLAAIGDLPRFDPTVADALWDTGQALRQGHRDPHGGSTSSSLEMAADELRHLGREAARLRSLATADADRDRLAEVACGAIDRLIVEPNHEAPALRM